jgi:two-component system, chemotaxis family, CheB/CheR fusion protein
MAGKTTAKKKLPAGKDKPAPSQGGVKTKAVKKAGDDNRPKTRHARQNAADMPVVGIGASAGGLEALQQLFKHMPADSQMAFVVIQHLSPHFKSAMDKLLAHDTTLPVTRITNNLKLEPGCIYLNPPDQFVSVAKGKLRLTPPRLLGRGVSLPIDHFFASLADARGEKAICIILSGSASDGTQGLKAVKAAGGLTFAQSPEDAKYPSMPESAIATRMVDFILPAKAIAETLAGVFKHPYLRQVDISPPDETDLDGNLKQIFALLQRKTGHDFSNYKTTTIRRRIARRMAVHQLRHIADYIKVMARDPSEPGRLLKDMLIGVTSFFRDQAAFEKLSEAVLIPLVQSKPTGDSIRVWVAGCSSGEEAYSIAILLTEVMERLNTRLTIQIFASDIDQDAINSARNGAFPENIAADVSETRLTRFFNHANDTYRPKKNIRDTIVFSVHNLIKDPPFSKIDLITCRNLMIYLKPELQKRILLLFHYALNPQGYLFLGPSETIGEFGDHFSVVSLKHKIFKHIDLVVASRYSIGPMPPPGELAVQETASEEKGKSSLTDIYAYTERIILDEYAPPGVLIDRNYDILQFFGQTDRFLKTPKGKASFNILKMAREGLAPKMRQCLGRAVTSGQATQVAGISIRAPQGRIRTAITVRPLCETSVGKELLIVLFEEQKNAGQTDAAKLPARDMDAASPDVGQLRDELNAAKEYLQVTIEELETSNEEYKATNEELQSVNEELQSANEELETSREELQSTNEELVTINAEHQQKIDELTKSNNDINNLLESTEIASLFLDLNLCVRRFTPAVTRIINLRQTDIGRPISDITTLMKGMDIHIHAAQVLEKLERKKLEVQDKKGRWYEMRLLPYRTIDNVIDGVTIAFIDITELRQVHKLRRVTAVFENSADAVTVQDFDGNILAWNRTAEALYGWTEKEAIRMHITELTAEKDRHEYAAMTRKLQRGETVAPFKIDRITKAGDPLAVQMHVTALKDEKLRPVKMATFERPVVSRQTGG